MSEYKTKTKTKTKPELMIQACEAQGLTLVPGAGIYTETGDLLLAEAEACEVWFRWHLPEMGPTYPIQLTVCGEKLRYGTDKPLHFIQAIVEGGDRERWVYDAPEDLKAYVEQVRADSDKEFIAAVMRGEW